MTVNAAIVARATPNEQYSMLISILTAAAYGAANGNLPGYEKNGIPITATPTSHIGSAAASVFAQLRRGTNLRNQKPSSM